MRRLPATVVSTTLQEPLDWPDATLVKGDAVEVVARLKEQSEVSSRSHGSASMNRALMAAGPVDRLQLTIFPVITGQTGAHPIFQDAADFDLEMIESRTFDGGIQELIYRPSLHVRVRRTPDESSVVLVESGSVRLLHPRLRQSKEEKRPVRDQTVPIRGRLSAHN